jgi:hypothetical protein
MQFIFLLLFTGTTYYLVGNILTFLGIRNPIVVARKLVDEQKKGLLPLGRVPPGFLVGVGARQVLLQPVLGILIRIH